MECLVPGVHGLHGGASWARGRAGVRWEEWAAQEGKLLFSPTAGASLFGGGRWHGTSCHRLSPRQPPLCPHLLRSVPASSPAPTLVPAATSSRLQVARRGGRGALTHQSLGTARCRKCAVGLFHPSHLRSPCALLPAFLQRCPHASALASGPLPARLSVPSTPCRPLASARNTPGLC